LIEPTKNACPKIIGGGRPEPSAAEANDIMIIVPFSEAEHLQINPAFHIPPVIVFGPEPKHGRCHSYGKVALA
jgi:hypothetical protein